MRFQKLLIDVNTYSETLKTARTDPLVQHKRAYIATLFMSYNMME